ncbi:MAG: hypothetical protein E3J82_06100 [Candidatus Thorarchaeota archaeon]|nr:MAG: hypothetical protein E3J82_06100 [Candidatus Thorarchaeota archaeon]
MVIHRPDYSQLPAGRRVIFLASGGRDSTAMVLEAHKVGITNAIMAFNDTGLNRNGAVDVLNQLADITGYKLEIVKYDGDKRIKDILHNSFERIPKVLQKQKESGSYYKNYFYCCHELKHKPMENYIKTLDEKVVLVLGLKGSDGAKVRRFRMMELRQDHTFIRVHKKNNRMYYYPLRDCANKDVAMILDEFGMNGIKSSGCRICPVFCIFPNMRKKDPLVWLRSATLARKMKIEFPLSDQAQLSVFCSGVA